MEQSPLDKCILIAEDEIINVTSVIAGALYRMHNIFIDNALMLTGSDLNW
jgi:hypothetical protein